MKRKSALKLIIALLIILNIFVLIILGAIIYTRTTGQNLLASITGRGNSEAEQMIQKAIEPTETQKEIIETNKSARVENEIIENVSYKIVRSTKDEITLRITAPDMREITKDYDIDNSLIEAGDPEALNDALMNYLLDSLDDRNCPTVENEVTVAYNEDGIEETYEFVDAMYGGLLSLYDENLERFLEAE